MPSIDANGVLFLGLIKERNTGFVIPRYQRSYSWDDSNLTEFWDDIEQTVVLQQDELFMGSIITCEADRDDLESPHERVKYIEVIDGQQRIATVSVLMRVLYDHISVNDKEWADDHILKKFLLADGVAERKLRMNKDDKIFFDQYVLDVEELAAPPRSGLRGSSKRLARALRFFKEKINALSADDQGQKAKRLFDLLQDNLSVVHIKARSDVDAYTVFETINSKKKDLTPSELLKNYFYSVTSGDQTKFKKVMERWEFFSDRLSQHDLDVTEFIRHYWISAFEGKVSEKQLYKTIKNTIKNEPSKVDQVDSISKILKTEVESYIQFASPPEFPKKGSLDELYSQLGELGIKQCFPFLLSLLTKNCENLDAVLKNIIRVSFRRSACDKNPNELEKLYSDYAYRVRVSGLSEVEKFLTDLDDLDVEDEEFDEYLTGGALSKKLVKFLLMRLEGQQQTGETRISPKDLEIEHILPQSPKSFEDWDVNLDEHKENVDKIGNLTIVGPDFNREMSNKSFAEKRPVYISSDIKITKQIGEDNEDWTVEKIHFRSKAIATAFASIYSA